MVGEHGCISCEHFRLEPWEQPCAACRSHNRWIPKKWHQDSIKPKELTEMRYVDYVYELIYTNCAGLDSIYEDYIIKLVGEYGLEALRKHNLIEGCGILNGRKLYTLCNKKED